MNYQHPRNIWAFSKPKEAALYYERALLVYNYLFDAGGKSFLENLMRYDIPHLLQKCDLDDANAKIMLVPAERITLIGPQFEDILVSGIKPLLAAGGVADSILDFPPEGMNDEMLPLVDSLQCMLRVTIGIQTQFLEDGGILLPDAIVEKGGLQDDTALTLANLKLVDTSKLSWEHIIEIRKDKEALEKLRNLKSFIFEDFQGRPSSYVEDKLLSLADEYERSAKSQGAEMIEGSIGLLFDKDVAASATASITLALFGEPTLALAASTPIIVKVGRIALEIRKMKRKIANEGRRNPVAFLHDVRRIAQGDA